MNEIKDFNQSKTVSHVEMSNYDSILKIHYTDGSLIEAYSDNLFINVYDINVTSQRIENIRNLLNNRFITIGHLKQLVESRFDKNLNQLEINNETTNYMIFNGIEIEHYLSLVFDEPYIFHKSQNPDFSIIFDKLNHRQYHWCVKDENNHFVRLSDDSLLHKHELIENLERLCKLLNRD